MSETTFTFRVEDSLKAAFSDAARQKDRTVAQLLRDFMRSYVAESQEDAEYDAWFRRKVAEGRADIRLGRVVDNETVMAEAAERRQHLLARLGEGK